MPYDVNLKSMRTVLLYLTENCGTYYVYCRYDVVVIVNIAWLLHTVETGEERKNHCSINLASPLKLPGKKREREGGEKEEKLWLFSPSGFLQAI